MNKTTLAVVVIVVLAVAGGAWWWMSRSAAPAQNAQIANPASVNCVTTLGGQLEIKDTAEGAVGICHLPDGRKCEEWALFRDGTCTDGAASTTAAAATQPSGDQTPVSQNLILGFNVSPTLGSYLSAYNGFTVYTYSKDTPNHSTCTGACAANWPPYIVPSVDAVHVPADIKGVGTITRADGSIQVTYNSMPLYFWKGDQKPGDTLGQGIGGAWFVVKP
ncbi:MAG: DUF333 domain-containing protein [Patescibacteria group bacterium]|nr:DUF333 domain-containing protein [Patescibacteria group bacterium]